MNRSQTPTGRTNTMCSFRSGDGLYGIDTRLIREVLGSTLPQTVPLAPKYIAGVVPYRGEVLTTVCFRVLLGLEAWSVPRYVLVLDDEDDELFGLAVDGVHGVVTLDESAMEANPSALDTHSMALFDSAYRMSSGLIVRLDPKRLRPSRLADSGLFAAYSKDRTEEER
jgi:purine-binding chemotaxis protein CheW